MSKQMDVLARRDLFEAATRLEEQADAIDRMRSEMVNPDDLSQQLLKLIAGMNEAKAAQVRPEPSRLEIAAMIFAGGTEQTCYPPNNLSLSTCHPALLMAGLEIQPNE